MTSNRRPGGPARLVAVPNDPPFPTPESMPTAEEQDLPDLAPNHVPAENRLGGRRPALFSIADLDSRQIWMRGCAPDEAPPGITVDQPYFGFGPVQAAPDYLWFEGDPAERPDSPPGRVRQESFAGQTFVLGAQQGMPQPLDGGSGMEIPLTTRFAVAYAAGREIEVLQDGEGRFYAELIELENRPAAISLPQGFRLRRIRLTSHWTTQMAPDAKVYFFVPENRSFAGPALTPPPGAGLG